MRIKNILSRIKEKKILFTLKKTPFYYQGVTTNLYSLAGYLGEKFECRYILDLGCNTAEDLIPLRNKFKIIGVDNSENISKCKSLYEFGQWIEFDFEKNEHLQISSDVLRKSVIVCTNLLDRIENSNNVLDNIRKLLDFCPTCVLTVINREKINQNSLQNINPKWNFSEFEKLITAKNFNIPFLGLNFDNEQKVEQNNIVAIIERNNSILNYRKSSLLRTPDDFKVIAIMTAFNEADIIQSSIKNLIDQKIDVYLIDNWSTDETYELAKKFKDDGLIGIERFPKDGPSDYYTWGAMLSRVEKLTQELDANWFIHHDSDEVRMSPWHNVNLKNAIYAVDKAGFNAIDHSVIDFHPTDDNFQPGSNFQEYLKYFEFGKRRGLFVQIKAWKNLDIPIFLSNSGGHEASFKGRKVFPYKFLLKHYPIRSQSHGEKKIFIEREPRWYKPERSHNWHRHYDVVSEGHNFLYMPEKLECFDEDFYKKFLLERISGIGIN